jgi:homoaconitase/3-isopropylmalate dehydratase large subunit
MSRHFDIQTGHYGKQVIVNLAENCGREGAVVNAYRERVEEMNRDDVMSVCNLSVLSYHVCLSFLLFSYTE